MIDLNAIFKIEMVSTLNFEFNERQSRRMFHFHRAGEICEEKVLPIDNII